MEHVDTFKNNGNTAFSESRYADALQHFTAAIDVIKEAKAMDHPQLAVLYSNRSFTFLKMGRHEKALADAEASIAAKPEWFKAHLRRGLALEQLKRFEEALTAFSKALSLEPSNLEVETKVQQMEHKLRAKGAPPAPATRTFFGTAVDRGARKGQKITQRPSLYDVYTTPDDAPKLYPCAPAWHKDVAGFATALVQSDQNSARLTLPQAIEHITVAAGNYQMQRGNDLCMYRLSHFYEDKMDVAMSIKEHRALYTKAGLSLELPPAVELEAEGRQISRTTLMGLDGFGEMPFHLNPATGTADPAKVNLNVDFPIECDWCKGTFAFKDPPVCECGEFFCSTECQSQDRKHGNHDNSCKLVLAAQERGGVRSMTDHYWHFVLSGRLEWPYGAVPNYSLKWKANKTLSDPKHRNYMDEFQYLMKDERAAIVDLVGKLQDATRTAKSKEEQQQATTILVSEMTLQYHRLSAYLPLYDSPQRMQFKLMMLSVIHRILSSFGMGSVVESPERISKKFAKTLDKVPPAELPADTSFVGPGAGGPQPECSIM